MKKQTSHLPGQLPKTFAELNNVHLLRVIRDKVDCDNATEIMDRLAVINKPTKDQSDYLDTLVVLIEDYEKEETAAIWKEIEKLTGLDSLKHLLEANDMKQSDLAELLGIGPSAVSMILSGQRPITAGHARILGKRFAVNPGLFIS